VIHRVSGMPYEDWIHAHIAEPLGLGLRWTEESVAPGRLAMGHELGPKEKGSPMVEVPHGWVMGACNSCGGLYGSLDDLAKYAAFELSAWPPRDAPENPVASRATLRESQTLRSTEFGVNWIIQEDAKLGRVVWHNGGVGGYCAELWMVPDRGIAVVALLGFGDGEADLQRTVKSSLADLEQVFPRTSAVLGPAMRERIDQLIALLEPDVGHVPDDLFTAEFRAAVPVDPMFSMLRQHGGSCRVSKASGGTNTARFSLDCRRGSMDLTVYLQTAAPHAIGGFYYDIHR
jgi:CubicO group peptidase (beta-lactamase class C family)